MRLSPKVSGVLVIVILLTIWAVISFTMFNSVTYTVEETVNTMMEELP